MQYGGRRGYSGDQRLYTPSLASRRSGERGQTLPDILWKASGVMTRPTSGLRLTVQHVDVPHAGPQGPPRAQRHNSSCSEPGRPSVLQHRTATSQPIRRNLQNARLLSRPQQTTVLHAATPSTHHTAAPKASRTMLPPLTPAPPAVAEPPPVEVDDEHSSTGPEDDSTLLGDSDSEEEVYTWESIIYGSPGRRFAEGASILWPTASCIIKSKMLKYFSYIRFVLMTREKMTTLPADLGLSQRQSSVLTCLMFPFSPPPTLRPPSPRRCYKTTCNSTWRGFLRPCYPRD